MLFLIGMPGVGKSYWGTQVAKAYDLNHVDTDVIIEKQTGKSITQIFAEDGENFFRDEESRVLRMIVDAYPPDTVVSCGGGLVVREENRAIMTAAGCVIYLQSSPELIASRMTDQNARPLLPTGENLEQQIHALYLQRKAFYQLVADFEMQVETIELIHFQPIVKTCINQR